VCGSTNPGVTRQPVAGIVSGGCTSIEGAMVTMRPSHRDVGAHNRAAGSVDDVAAADHEVVHCVPPTGREQPTARDLPIA
jgi:hypothetical protein